MAKTTDTGGLPLLKSHLKSGDFARLYLFYGEERYLLEHYLGMLRKKLLDGPAADFNFHRFPQGAVDLQALADAVEAVPMMADARWWRWTTWTSPGSPREGGRR